MNKQKIFYIKNFNFFLKIKKQQILQTKTINFFFLINLEFNNYILDN